MGVLTPSKPGREQCWVLVMTTHERKVGFPFIDQNHIDLGIENACRFVNRECGRSNQPNVASFVYVSLEMYSYDNKN